MISYSGLLQKLNEKGLAKTALAKELGISSNSNHIEGSKLSEDQTRLIFETNTIDIGEGIPVDDIIETVNLSTCKL